MEISTKRRYLYIGNFNNYQLFAFMLGMKNYYGVCDVSFSSDRNYISFDSSKFEEGVADLEYRFLVYIIVSIFEKFKIE